MPKAKFSQRFGQMVDGLLTRHGISQSEAHVRSEGRISKSYWGNLRLGFVPTYDKVVAIAETFPDEDLAELFEAAGYAPPRPRRTELPPGARLLASDTSALPLGVPIPASGYGGEGEVFPDEDFDASQSMRDAGASYTLVVDGDCLAPQIERGDVVYIRPTSSPAVGDVVVVAHEEAYTLKLWRRRDGLPWLGTADEARFPGFRPAATDRVVGVVVGMMKIGTPRFR